MTVTNARNLKQVLRWLNRGPKVVDVYRLSVGNGYCDCGVGDVYARSPAAGADCIGVCTKLVDVFLSGHGLAGAEWIVRDQNRGGRNGRRLGGDPRGGRPPKVDG